MQDLTVICAHSALRCAAAVVIAGAGAVTAARVVAVLMWLCLRTCCAADSTGLGTLSGEVPRSCWVGDLLVLREL